MRCVKREALRRIDRPNSRDTAGADRAAQQKKFLEHRPIVRTHGQGTRR
jgi:hypothetical protein